MTLGGRAAEEIVFGEVTTGASNDLEKVTATAKQMVMRFGMSEKLGPRVFGHDHGMPFLGREFSAEPDYSDEIAREIDDEIRRIVESAHVQAKDILSSHRESLTKLSEILIKRETIEKEQFEALLDGGTEEEVFGAEAPPPPEVPIPPDAGGRAAARVRVRCRGLVSPAAPPSRPSVAPSPSVVTCASRSRSIAAVAVVARRASHDRVDDAPRHRRAAPGLPALPGQRRVQPRGVARREPRAERRGRRELRRRRERRVRKSK